MMMTTYKELVQSSVTASEVKRVVKWSEMSSEVKWVTVKFLWIKWSEVSYSEVLVDKVPLTL